MLKMNFLKITFHSVIELFMCLKINEMTMVI